MELSEVEMAAEEAEVEVVPTFAEPTVHLIGGDVGPLEPGVPLKVPLFVALYLKRRHKSRILPPPWLNAATLQGLLKEEQDGPLFTTVPERYMEIGTLLLREASDDIHEGDEIKVLLKDLWDVREAKLRKDVSRFVREPGQVVARIDGLTEMEIGRVRASVLAALRLKTLLAATAADAAMQDQNPNNSTSLLHSST